MIVIFFIWMIFFSDRIEKFIPPQKGRKHILYIIRELLEFKPESLRTNVGQAVEFLTQVIKRRCTAFILSDFLDSKDFRQPLTIANRKHDVVAIQVYDRRIAELPDVGLMKVQDAETGITSFVDTSSKSMRTAYAKWWNDSVETLDKLFRKTKVDYVSVGTAEDYVKPLQFLFKSRHR